MVEPSTAYDAKGLLKAAIRDDDPVLYFEHKYLYRRIKDEVPEDDYIVPIGKAAVRREGATCRSSRSVRWSTWRSTRRSTLAEEGVRGRSARSAEPRAARSGGGPDIGRARPAGRCSCTRATLTGGIGGELAAIIAEEAFEYLDAPVMRVASRTRRCRTSPPLEAAFLPNVDKVVAACESWWNTESGLRLRRVLESSMATNVVMPQMGESIAEGTIVRWIKKVGDAVDRDEPLFEISTDKVDAEIPSPAAGVLTESRSRKGRRSGQQRRRDDRRDGEEPSAAAKPPRRLQRLPPAKCDAEPAAAVGSRKRARRSAAAGRSSGSGLAERPAAMPARKTLRRQKSSPLVRRIAQEHDVDIPQIQGTGISGRVTKHDILGYIESGAPQRTAPPRRSGRPARCADTSALRTGPASASQIVPMSVMRKKIAEHMVLSAHTSPHVYSVYEVNFGAGRRAAREAEGASTKPRGAKLTFTAFIAKVAIDALRQFPIVNASIDGDNIVYKKDINLGIAVALENGLIVPVIRNADEKNLLGLSRAIDDLADPRAGEEAESRRRAGWHVHDHQPGHLRRALRPAADQPAAGGDPRRRRHREARGRDRRCDRASGRCATSRSATTIGWSTAPTPAGSCRTSRSGSRTSRKAWM